MRRFLTIAAAGFLALTLSAPVAAEAPPKPPDPYTRMPSDEYPFTAAYVAELLGPKTFNLPPGQMTGTADVSAISLPDGRTRLFFGYFGGTVLGLIGSAISTDGRSFAVETTNLISGASPYVYRLADGRYRMYFTSGGIASAISTDGQTFTKEPGLRLAKDAFKATSWEMGGLSASAIVPLRAGGYRMYLHQAIEQYTFNGGTFYNWAVLSAVSNNLLDWTPEPGVRIGPGATKLTGTANHPTVVSDGNGGVYLIYYRVGGGLGDREYISHSKDGLTFTTENYTGIEGTEASALQRDDGTIWLYHGTFTPATGSLIHLSIITPVKNTTAVTPTPSNRKSPTKVLGLTCKKGAKKIVVTGRAPKCPAGFSRVKGS